MIVNRFPKNAAYLLMRLGMHNIHYSSQLIRCIDYELKLLYLVLKICKVQISFQQLLCVLVNIYYLYIIYTVYISAEIIHNELQELHKLPVQNWKFWLFICY